MNELLSQVAELLSKHEQESGVILGCSIYDGDVAYGWDGEVFRIMEGDIDWWEGNLQKTE